MATPLLDSQISSNFNHLSNKRQIKLLSVNKDILHKKDVNIPFNLRNTPSNMEMIIQNTPLYLMIHLNLTILNWIFLYWPLKYLYKIYNTEFKKNIFPKIL